MCQVEMPKYQCYKQVWALKIGQVRAGNKTPELVPEEESYAPIQIDWDWYYRHKPEEGGYYVVYSDGYKSYSPAKAFEQGYERV